MAPDLRPLKRRKKDIEPQLGPKLGPKFSRTGPELQIRLTRSQAEQFGLEQTTFMEFEKLEYVTFNSDNPIIFTTSAVVFLTSARQNLHCTIL